MNKDPQEDCKLKKVNAPITMLFVLRVHSFRRQFLISLLGKT
jgi:hypothetical protein